MSTGDLLALSPKTHKYPFLPPGHQQRWLTYVWLAYLLWFILEGCIRAASWRGVAGVAAGVVVFLPLYFGVYWVDRTKVLWIAAAMCVLGTVYAPSHSGATTFFIYAAASLAQLNNIKPTLWALGGVLVWNALTAYFLNPSPSFWISGGLAVIFVGLISVYRIQECHSRARLRVAQSEVERFAKIAERERIARDLHDLLGHTLSLIVLKSEVASRFADIDPARAATEIRDVDRISREAPGTSAHRRSRLSFCRV